MKHQTVALGLLAVAGGALLLTAGGTASAAQVEPGDGDASGLIDWGAIMDSAAGAINRATAAPAQVDEDRGQRNAMAVVRMIYWSEGTLMQPDPYRVCYGYRHTIQSFADHPAITGEWRGELLPDEMCANAGYGPGCRSTAAGAGQITKGTWLECKARKGLPDFGPASQDAAVLDLIERAGALEDARAGRIAEVARKCAYRWASLPGSKAKQGGRTLDQLTMAYESAGGTYA